MKTLSPIMFKTSLLANWRRMLPSASGPRRPLPPNERRHSGSLRWKGYLNARDWPVPRRTVPLRIRFLRRVPKATTTLPPIAALPVLQDAAIANMRRAAIGPDGTIDQAKLDRWMAKYADAIRAIDERVGGGFSQRMRNAADASESVANAAATRRRILDQYANGTVGKLINAADNEDISRTIGGLFNGNVANARNFSRLLTLQKPETAHAAP